MNPENIKLPTTFKYSKYLYFMLNIGLVSSIGLVILGYVGNSIGVAIIGLIGISGMTYLIYNASHSYCS